MSSTPQPPARLRNLTPANRRLILIAVGFVIVVLTPFEATRVSAGIQEAFLLLSYYAEEHVLLCLVPAFFIAGAIMVFLDRQAVIKYLGPSAPKPLAYGVGAVSGSILSVCSCTVLPLFKGIYQKGAGIGPAIAFLYSGPAINVMAIILTARVLGLQLGLARAVGSVLFAVILGLAMHVIFRAEDEERTTNAAMFETGAATGRTRSLHQDAGFVGVLILILIVLNWPEVDEGFAVWRIIHAARYPIAALFGAVMVTMIVRWFKRQELTSWVSATRDFALQITPLLFAGILVAGFLLGRPGQEALIPEQYVAALVGGNSLGANVVAALAGALMYFATLTEVPIMQGLIGAGMGQGPALALLLAGPSLSLPAMLVIHGELGTRKTITYVLIVVVVSSLAGMLYGTVFA